MTPYDAEEIAEQSLERDRADNVRAYVCAECDTAIDAHEKHPVVARSDGPVSVLLFCGQDCRTAWLDSEGER